MAVWLSSKWDIHLVEAYLNTVGPFSSIVTLCTTSPWGYITMSDTIPFNIPVDDALQAY